MKPNCVSVLCIECVQVCVVMCILIIVFSCSTDSLVSPLCWRQRRMLSASFKLESIQVWVFISILFSMFFSDYNVDFYLLLVCLY